MSPINWREKMELLLIYTAVCAVKACVLFYITKGE